MKKIFIIMQKEIVDTVGGTITIFIDYCNMLVNNGYNVFGLFYSDKNGKPQTLNSNVNYINLKKLANGCLKFNEAINYITEKEKPDLFIFFFPRLYNLSKLDKKFDNIPRILMFHGRPDYYFNNNHKLAKELEPYYVNTVSQILIPSYIDLLPNYIKNSKVVYIPNPSSIGTEVINVDNEKKKIVFLSRIAPCKGLDFLIKSFMYVIKKHPDWQLDIYGQSQPINYKDDLNYLINKLKLDNNIKIKGISSNPLNTFLDYDFCVFPSIIEGFPMGLVEAQSVGLPAIGLKGCSGVNELIIDNFNGYLSDRKYKEFASKINQLIENKEIRRTMSKNAVAEAQKYERNKIYNMWLDLIKNTIDSNYNCNFDKKIKCKYKLFPIKQVLKWDKYNPYLNLNLFQEFKKNIFSISKDYKHKQIIFLGLKIKIKNNIFQKVQTNYKINLKRIKNKYKNNEKIKVLFLSSEIAKWGYDSLYRLFEKNDMFEPIIGVFPLSRTINGSDSTQPTQEEQYNFYKNKGMNVIYLYTDNGYLQLDNIQPDIVFYQQQWDLPYNYQPIQVSKYALTFGCSYSYNILACKGNYTLNFHDKLYKYYVESEFHKKTYSKQKGYSENCTVVGYSKLDKYLDKQIPDTAKYWKQPNKIKIIYAPHHSLDEKDKDCIFLATFRENGKLILEYAKSHPETTWAFKPHPRFKYILGKEGIMSIKEIDEYYNEWAKVGNIYESGDYIDIFKTSDLMLTDCCSFLAEYLPTGKPLIRMINPKGIKLNKLGERICSEYYISHNNKELIQFLDKLVTNKNDDKYLKRQEIINTIIDYKKSAAEKIFDDIIHTVEN